MCSHNREVLNARELIGNVDVFFVTLDTLRFDVAEEEFSAGRLPVLSRRFDHFEQRHAPGSFTYASHQAMFAGFLPTPARPGPHPRLFALAFPGSETTTSHTCTFDAPDIITGFRERGYHTICIGGVGFFNKLTPLGRVLPNLFDESHWERAFGVTDARSTEHQVARALARLDESVGPTLLFLNVSALHQPNHFYLPGTARKDTRETHAAALRYVDGALGPLFEAFEKRKRATLCVVCSDHGTAYGEDGFVGHRLGHAVVWDVPYAEFVLT